MCLLELEEKGHPSLFLCCFAHPSVYATGKWKGRREKGKGKSPETLSSACFPEEQGEKRGRDGGLGQNLLSSHAPAHPCTVESCNPRKHWGETGGDSPGTGLLHRAFSKFPLPKAKHNLCSHCGSVAEQHKLILPMTAGCQPALEPARLRRLIL